MTHWEIFSAEQLFLLNARKVLEADESTLSCDVALAERATAIMSCAFALEALLNLLLRHDGRISLYEGINTKAKLEILGVFAHIEVAFNKEPWQAISELIKTRNWLVHFKEPTIGFLGSLGYVGDSAPKRAPTKSLTKEALKVYYESVLHVGQVLVDGLGMHKEFSYLWSQEYEPWIIG